MYVEDILHRARREGRGLETVHLPGDGAGFLLAEIHRAQWRDMRLNYDERKAIEHACNINYYGECYLRRCPICV